MSRYSRRKSSYDRTYPIVSAATSSGTSTGVQKLIARIHKVDAQGIPAAYVNNVKVSVMVNEAEQDVGGIMCYATTDGAWNDNFIITAGATSGPGGSVNLRLKRPIRTNAEDQPAMEQGIGGPIYIWVEIADYVATEEFRWVTEVWGKRHLVVEE